MLTNIILTGKHGRPSTKLAWSFLDSSDKIFLVQRRQLPAKTYYRVFADQEQYEDSQLYQSKLSRFLFNNTKIIRWGTRETITGTNMIIYNKASAIASATNKKMSRELFEQNGVNAPYLLKEPSEHEGITIARPLIHSKGKNFIVLNSQKEVEDHWNENWYYSRFIDKDREFRVHCGSGKVIGLMEKHKPDNNSLAWNRAVSGTDPFTRLKQYEADEQDLRNVLIESLSAIEALGLDMGAVDIMLKDGVPYVLEVNTAPTLNSSPHIAEEWSKYWKWLFNSDQKRNHWDFRKFKKASSLFWKQDQYLQ